MRGGRRAARRAVRFCLGDRVFRVEVVHSLAQALGGELLSAAHRHARIVVLLVGLDRALGVADLALQVRVELRLIRADAVPVGPLRVRVDVHLDHAGLDRVPDVLGARTRAAVEDEENGLVRLGARLLLDELLRVVEDLRRELYVARGVDAVHVAEGGGDGEHAVGDRAESLVDLVHLRRLRVEQRVVDLGVVDAVLLAAGHAQLDLKEQVGLGHALKVLLADRDVLLERLLGEVEHVRREKGLAVCLEVGLVRVEKTVEPPQPRLHAVVGVEDHGDAVEGGHSAHVEGGGDAAGDGRGIVFVVGGLACDELPAAARELDDDRRFVDLRSLEARGDSRGGDNVDGGDGVLVRLGVLEQVEERLAGNDARLDRGRKRGSDRRRRDRRGHHRPAEGRGAHALRRGEERQRQQDLQHRTSHV
mmetsp:Transcript_9915/g.23855  ORF Transcript_9915/g.23855 Transcript_9915/m.23855 type:complete len:419 (+) Transcript_9915:316-1572(+)